ncbi:DUF3489 domain-containing protein [Roseomonas terrae]|uniref:DUF3489 domain-containing protein n=1 Tax=Neoroseomonas terrae TaxID=424799 RepID=A0ABS5EMB3_9PROT|nr:DUF3489 domain-containing protein [Neoroseomonas terrae]
MPPSDAAEREGLDHAVAALRAVLAAKPGRPPRDRSAPRHPRNATGWQPHTVRGFLAGLKRRGITIEVLERVRQVGPGSQGAKGSYSIYRIAG